MNEYFVDSDEKLHELCDLLRKSRVLAIDTEFMRERTYFAKFCLLQIATDELIACVDPLALNNIDPLLDIIYTPDTVKVLHAARQDLELFFDLRGTLPGPVFDTQIAAALMGYGAQVSYGALVKDMCNVTLDKSHARTDWSQRPLDPQQLHYAADDVRYLLSIYEQQSASLQEKGRLEWLSRDFESLVDERIYKRNAKDVWMRIRGTQTLAGNQLAVIQALAAWREEKALSSNKPRKWIVADDPLLSIAKFMPKTPERLAKIRGLDEKVRHRCGEEIIQIVNQASQMPEEQWPELLKRVKLSDAQEAVIDVMMGILRRAGYINDVSPQVITTRKELERVLLGDKDVAVLEGWRHALVGKDLLALLAGNLYLQIKQGELAIAKQD
jgi:ribonuclease D